MLLPTQKRPHQATFDSKKTSSNFFQPKKASSSYFRPIKSPQATFDSKEHPGTKFDSKKLHPYLQFIHWDISCTHTSSNRNKRNLAEINKFFHIKYLNTKRETKGNLLENEETAQEKLYEWKKFPFMHFLSDNFSLPSIFL